MNMKLFVILVVILAVVGVAWMVVMFTELLTLAVTR
jgi:hypothetical protein